MSTVTTVRQEAAASTGTPTQKAVTCGNSNVKMSSMMSALDPSKGGHFLEGTVYRTDVGWYGVMVAIDGRGEVGCSVLTSTASNYFGTSECTLPIEGSRVLVYLANPNHNRGIIIGVVPPTDTLPMASADATPMVLSRYASLWEYESNASVGSNSPYLNPLKDKTKLTKVSATAGRPLDALPGAQMFVNEQGVGMAVTALAATIKGSAKAQVRVSCIDDQVRIVSGHFIHYNAGGVSQTYNDGGLITTEIGFTGYQAERMGLTQIGDAAFTAGAATDDVRTGMTTIYDPVKPRLTPKKRFQAFLGHLGDLVNIFVATPDPAHPQETEDTESNDQGLAHLHLDGSGLITVKTAGGISLQRSDRIPVPNRLRQPWDPQGDKIEDRGELAPKPAFDFGALPYGRSAQLRDASAWRDRGAYWRLHNQSTAAGSKDFNLPEENELVTPVDRYDETGGATEKFGAYEKRKSFVNLEPDGSIILRDAWGSEIVMAGGNITISCAGQLQVRSGKSTVVLAGHDLVMKAQESVDVTAEKHDVRIKADSKIAMVATGLNSGDGGILLESKSTGVMPWSGKGEVGRGGGIVMKALNSMILLEGNNVDLSGREGIQIETFGEGTSSKGTIQLSASQIEANAKDSLFLTQGKKAAMWLVSDSAWLAGSQVNLISAYGLSLTQGNKMWVPAVLSKLEVDPYIAIAKTIKERSDLLQGLKWLQLSPLKRKDIAFTYRSSPEYGTVGATEVQGGVGFAVYQPAWAFMAQKRSVMLGGAMLASWSEDPVKETYPWPGAGARGGGYKVLDSEVNVTSSSGLSKDRAGLTETSGTFSARSFNEIETIQHT